MTSSSVTTSHEVLSTARMTIVGVDHPLRIRAGCHLADLDSPRVILDELSDRPENLVEGDIVAVLPRLECKALHR